MLETRREIARRHVITGRRIIAGQRRLVERLRVAGAMPARWTEKKI
jgi:hypothetical protein